MRRPTLLLPLLLLTACSGTAAPAPSPPATPAAATPTTATRYANNIGVQVSACAYLGDGTPRAQVAEKLQSDFEVTEPEAQRAIDKGVADDGLCPFNRAAANT